MPDAFSQLNWIAVAIATVASIVVAGVYFGVVVAKPYLRVLGRDVDDRPEPTAVAAVGPLVCVFVTVLTSAVLVAALDLDTAGDALVFGLVVGIGYLVTMAFQIAINPNVPHPIRYGLLNAPFFVTTSVLSSLLLVLV